MKRLYHEDKPMYYFYRITQILASSIILYSIFLFMLETDLPFADKPLFLFGQATQILVFSFLPALFEKVFIAKVPRVLYFLSLLFFLLTVGVGEIGGVYAQNHWWDKLMHVLSGILITFVGFSLVALMNNGEKLSKFQPFFVVLFAFCFTTTIGVLWEIFEYGADYFVGSNMQRFRNSITQVPFVGQEALKDTMLDFIMNSIGALLTSIYGYWALKQKNQGVFQRLLIHPLKNGIIIKE